MLAFCALPIKVSVAEFGQCTHRLPQRASGETAMLSKENCAAILNAGSNMKISGLPKEALIELARIARNRGVRLEIKCDRSSGVSPDSMVEIAEAGGPNVLLDFSD